MRIPLEVLAERYRAALFAAAFSVCRDPLDAEDAVQDTFVQYQISKKEFDSEQHVRAWLIRVAVNRAKNLAMSFWRRKKVPLEQYEAMLSFDMPEYKDLFEAVMALPQAYRVVLHLYYYEEYSVREIGQMLNVRESAVKAQLMRGRKLLKKTIGEAWNNDRS